MGVDIVADSGGIVASVVAEVHSLGVLVSGLTDVVNVLVVAVALLLAVEVARGVMRR